MKISKNIYKIILASAFIAGATACHPELDLDDNQKPSNTGTKEGKTVTLDFSNYIAIGNSLTAGVSDGGLYAESQANSFPLILSEQFAAVGGGAFTQPTIPGNGSGYRYISEFVDGSPVILTREADPNAFAPVSGDFHNMGVPGIRLVEITGPAAAVAQQNQFYGRFLDTSQDYLSQIVAANPTFFTFWLGSNDVLGYATTGGAYGEAGNALEGGRNGITDVAAFESIYTQAIAALTEDGTTSGVVATIADVTTIPFFTTVPNFIEFDALTAEGANLLMKSLIDPGVTEQVTAGVTAQINAAHLLAVDSVTTLIGEGRVEGEAGIDALSLQSQAAIGLDPTQDNRDLLDKDAADPTARTGFSQAFVISGLTAELLIGQGIDPATATPEQLAAAQTDAQQIYGQSQELQDKAADIALFLSAFDYDDWRDYTVAFAVMEAGAEAVYESVFNNDNDVIAKVNEYMASDIAQELLVIARDTGLDAWEELLIAEQAIVQFVKGLQEAQGVNPDVALAAGEKALDDTITALKAVGQFSAQALVVACEDIRDQAIAETIPVVVESSITSLKAGGYYPVFVEGKNQLPANDATSPTGLKVMDAGDLVTLNAAAGLTQLQELLATGALPEGLDPTTLLPNDTTLLTVAEQEVAKSAVLSYNEIIREVAAANDNVVLFDAFAVMNTLAEEGLTQDNLTLTADFVSGGAFSLDGIHLTPRGYSVIASEMINALNKEYGTSVPSPKISNYNAVILP